MWNIRKNKLIPIIMIAISTLLLLITKANAGFVDIYREYLIIPQIFRIYSIITGLLPFSLAEILIYLIIPVILVLLVCFVAGIVRRKDKKLFLASVGTGVLIFVSVVYTMFVLACGIYYYRPTIGTYLGYSDNGSKPIKAEELYEVCRILTEECNEMAKQVDRSRYNDFDFITEETKKAYRKLGDEYNIFSDTYGMPKAVLMSKYMSYTEIVGIFIPFTMEANVNTHVAGYTIPFNACHEMAHMYGFMREDEANFISYLACMASDNVEMKYSGVMQALIFCQNQLLYMDEDMWDKINIMLEEDSENDFTDNNEYWNEIENDSTGKIVSDVSDDINDTYLKANGQADGVQSYDRMVNLMVAMYRNHDIK